LAKNKKEKKMKTRILFFLLSVLLVVLGFEIRSSLLIVVGFGMIMVVLEEAAYPGKPKHLWRGNYNSWYKG